MIIAEEGACSTVCLVAKMIPKHTKLFKAVARHVDSCKIAQQADSSVTAIQNTMTANVTLACRTIPRQSGIPAFEQSSIARRHQSSGNGAGAHHKRGVQPNDGINLFIDK
jgi:hypothetical protein